MRGLVSTFGIIHDSIQIYYDSQSAIYLAKDHMYHKRTKHLDVRYHMIHHLIIVEKVIDLVSVKISTKKNLVDMMTKTISVEKFKASLNFIQVLQR